MNILQKAGRGGGSQTAVSYKGSASIVGNDIQVNQLAVGNEVKQTRIARVE